MNFDAVKGTSETHRRSPQREIVITADSEGVVLNGEFQIHHPSDAAKLFREIRLSFADHMFLKKNPEESPRIYSTPYDVDLILENEELRRELEELQELLQSMLDADGF